MRDRANVALGFTALTEGDPKLARSYLERVRLKSLQSNKALLGFGWAADSLKDPKLALVPWLELAGRDVGDSAALEARIAVPYAYVKLGAYGQALERYNAAIAAFDQESKALKESIVALRSPKWIDTMIDANPGDEMGWFWRIGDLPDVPHAAPPVAGAGAARVPGGVQELPRPALPGEEPRRVEEQARRLRRHAGDPAQGLRRQAAAGAGARRRHRHRAAGEAPRGASPRRSRRASRPATASPSPTPRSSTCSQRVKTLRSAIDAPGAEAEVTALRDRVRLAGGLLSWQLAKKQIDRVWALQKELQRIDAELAEVKRRDAELAAAQKEEPLRFDRFGQRIAALTPLLNVMIPRVAALEPRAAEGRPGHRRRRAHPPAGAARRRTRPRRGSRVAQLYDRAYANKEPERAPAKP